MINKTNQWPFFADDEVAAVERVLRSGKVNYWTGEEGRLFEKEFAEFAGTQYAVALANGTVALEAALFACDIGPGDDVIVACRTFIASASCIVMRGARPVLADVDRISQNITVDTIKAVMTRNTKAIIAVHLAGWPCDMDPIMKFARENSLKVIEDCAQAHGAKYKGRHVGSLGDVAAFSFCQDKIMTTGGEGGMLTTNDPEIWRKVWSFKDHGKSFDATQVQSDSSCFRWLHESFGTNLRMTEIQAAIGRIQLRKLSAWVEMRRRNADIITKVFAEIPSVRVTLPPAEIMHSYYKYYIFLRPDRIKEGWDRDRIISELGARGVVCGTGACSEIYLEKAFDGKEFRPLQPLSVAKELGETSLMFLVHPTLSEGEMLRCCRVIQQVLLETTL